MKNKNLKIVVLLLAVFLSPLAYGQDFPEESKGLMWSLKHGFEYRLKAGLNIGGASPIPIPAEIRKIEKYSPNLSITLEGDIIKWLVPDWGIMVGLRLEDKGMTTKARVKDYHMEMNKLNDDGSWSYLEGAWTGYVKTKVRNTYVTLPVLGLYKLSPRWELKAGGFVSFLIHKDFSGDAYDGYIRDVDPTGEKIEVTTAVYDFSKDLRKIQWGVDVGAEWKAYKHLNVFTDLTWSFSPLFKKNFESITFKMYNIYANVGFGYVF